MCINFSKKSFLYRHLLASLFVLEKETFISFGCWALHPPRKSSISPISSTALIFTPFGDDHHEINEIWNGSRHHHAGNQVFFKTSITRISWSRKDRCFNPRRRHSRKEMCNSIATVEKENAFFFITIRRGSICLDDIESCSTMNANFSLTDFVY